MALQEPDIPTRFPPFITAGASFKVDRQFPDYPAGGSSGWKYTLILSGTAILTKDATPDANGVIFHLVLTPTDTQPLNPGGGVALPYQYRERLTALDGSGEIYDVTADGRIMIEPNLAIAQPGDAVSFAEKTLLVIEAALSNRLTADIQNYSIAGRSISKIPVEELMKLHTDFLKICHKQRRRGKFSDPIDVTFPVIGWGPYPWLRRWGGV